MPAGEVDTADAALEPGGHSPLASAAFPVTVIWGLRDTVAPPRVASYVWNQYLMLKPGRNRLYFIPARITTCRPTGQTPS